MATTWIKADVSFEAPMATLVLPVSRAVQANAVRSILNECRDKPEEMERLVLGLINEFRPDLAGGVVLSVQFDVARMLWRFVYVHPSLPRMDGYTPAPEQDLIPGAEPLSASIIVEQAPAVKP